jgi:acyl carrier protein
MGYAKVPGLGVYVGIVPSAMRGCPEAPMDQNVIRDSIKQSIARITGIPPDEISDTASYRDDLGLDSLSMLEVAVDAELCFQVKIPDERMPEIQSVADAVRMVGEYLAASQARA